MIFAGPCSYIDSSDEDDILKTANALRGHVDYFRVKIYLGGTRPDKYFEGIGYAGISLLNFIDKNILPVGVEIQTEGQAAECMDKLSFLWVGARNSQNYGLLRSLSCYQKPLMLKRGPGITIDETIGLYDIMKTIHRKEIYIIERGINTFDRLDDSRWSPDLKGAIRIKNERDDIFKRLIIDCSHSVGRKEYVQDTYKAFKAIGCEHFMFECTYSGKSRTDSRHMLSTDELLNIIRE